ncbi:hypothetical protein ABT369_26560 [Dactylosporangium sp. NPDC000244]
MQWTRWPGVTLPGPVGSGTPMQVSVGIASSVVGCQPGVTGA